MGNHPDREEALFEAALELKTPLERDQFLQEACRGDDRLRDQVNSLLRAHHHSAGFLEKPAPGVNLTAAAATLRLPETAPQASPVPTENPGDHIGRYKLLQKIGEGGCGVVYMAEQEQPVRRRVALKIIKIGMDTRQVIARFEAERQALAMMEHPNIARVLDAGATETGRPFFVMDLVRGIRITDYCDQSNLSTEDRLGLFIQVCHAIQHAHQKGIIHRDIKPSNILVTLHDGVPVPVIIDFGIAKATERRLTDKTLFTAFEQFIGTPAYMSPEQAEMSGLDIDTRSDIYALGVLLYELLTGKTPFDAQTLVQGGLDEMRRTIREKEPPRPSTRLSTMLEADLTKVAKHRQAEPVRLIHLMRGDLDWIVMKCLEKDRTRRYETANGLALDVARHLNNEPVLARPPSRLYRCQKLIRRNRGVVAAGAAVAVALVIGLAVSTHLYLLQREAYQRVLVAERNQNRLRQEAENARASEREQHRLSEDNARRSRLNSYAADIYSAFLAVQGGNLGRAIDLLEHQIPPRPGQDDLRGFEWAYLWQQAQGDELISLPHDGLVSCAAFSSDAQQLVTASYDGHVRIWDLATKRVTKSIGGFEQQFGWRYIACSPDGRWLAGWRAGKLTVWPLEQAGEAIQFEKPCRAKVIAFSPDGRWLTGWGQGELLVVSTADWSTRAFQTRLHSGSFPAVAFDPTGTRIALAGEGQFAVEIWSVDSGTPQAYYSFPRQGMAFVSLAWSPEGLLAGATWSGALLLINPETGQEVASARAHTGTVFGLAFGPGRGTLVTAGHDQLIQFWSLPNLGRLGTLRGHRDEIWSLAFSADKRLLCTAGKDGTARVWSPTPRPAPTFLPPVRVGVFSADSRFYVTLPDADTECTLDFWDVANPGVRTSKKLSMGTPGHPVRTILSSDAKLAAVENPTGTVEIWNVDTGKLLQARPVARPGLKVAAFSGQGRFLALGSADGTVELWNLKTGQSSKLESQNTGAIELVSFTPGNRYVWAVTKESGEEWMWDLRNHSRVPLTFPHSERFQISSDDHWLALASTNYTVEIRNLESGARHAVLEGHRWTINAIAFSKDNELVATGGADAVCRLWNVRTGTEVTRPLRGHLQGVTDLAFSPDARVLATGSTDNTVKIWHVATGRELFSAADASEPAFSPDGNTLLLHTSKGRQLLHVPTLIEIDSSRSIVQSDR